MYDPIPVCWLSVKGFQQLATAFFIALFLIFTVSNGGSSPLFTLSPLNLIEVCLDMMGCVSIDAFKILPLLLTVLILTPGVQWTSWVCKLMFYKIWEICGNYFFKYPFYAFLFSFLVSSWCICKLYVVHKSLQGCSFYFFLSVPHTV